MSWVVGESPGKLLVSYKGKIQMFTWEKKTTASAVSVLTWCCGRAQHPHSVALAGQFCPWFSFVALAVVGSADKMLQRRFWAAGSLSPGSGRRRCRERGVAARGGCDKIWRKPPGGSYRGRLSQLTGAASPASAHVSADRRTRFLRVGGYLRGLGAALPPSALPSAPGRGVVAPVFCSSRKVWESSGTSLAPSVDGHQPASPPRSPAEDGARTTLVSPGCLGGEGHPTGCAPALRELDGWVAQGTGHLRGRRVPSSQGPAPVLLPLSARRVFSLSNQDLSRCSVRPCPGAAPLGEGSGSHLSPNAALGTWFGLQSMAGLGDESPAHLGGLCGFGGAMGTAAGLNSQGGSGRTRGGTREGTVPLGWLRRLFVEGVTKSLGNFSRGGDE